MHQAEIYIDIYLTAVNMFTPFFLQAPFNTLEYDIIGDDAAPTYFSINSVSGNIFLQSSISNDASDVYYVSILV